MRSPTISADEPSTVRPRTVFTKERGSDPPARMPIENSSCAVRSML